MEVKKDFSLMEQYLFRLGDSHKGNPIALIDFRIREAIGKTDDPEKLRVGMCSHQAILGREMIKRGVNPEHRCRKCGINLNVVGVGRVNDYLVLRNPNCLSPICLD